MQSDSQSDCNRALSARFFSGHPLGNRLLVQLVVLSSGLPGLLAQILAPDLPDFDLKEQVRPSVAGIQVNMVDVI